MSCIFVPFRALLRAFRKKSRARVAPGATDAETELRRVNPKKGVSWDVSIGQNTTAKPVKTSSLPAIKTAKFGHERKFGNVHPAIERQLLKMDLEDKLKRAEKNRKEQLEERSKKLQKRHQDVMFVNDLRFLENEVL